MRRPKSVSGIGWCDRSWNPWQGCIKVSPGCEFCYTYRDEARYGQDPARVVRSKTSFNVPLKWKASQLILTKRPGCIPDHLPHDRPWPHAWLGVSV